MNNRKGKRPAHEVILGHIEEVLHGIPDMRKDPLAYSACRDRFEMLCGALSKMELPEKPREVTVRKVRQLAEDRRNHYSFRAQIAIPPKDGARKLIKEELTSDPFLDVLGGLLKELRVERV